MTQTSAVTIQDVESFFQSAFGDRFKHIPKTLELGDGMAAIKMDVRDHNIRPGGYISGPTQMALADHAAYVAVFTKVGIKPMALTSNLSIDFLRPCMGESLTATATMAKIGRTLAVINVEMRGSSSDKVSSQAVVTYVLPQDS